MQPTDALGQKRLGQGTSRSTLGGSVPLPGTKSILHAMSTFLQHRLGLLVRERVPEIHVRWAKCGSSLDYHLPNWDGSLDVLHNLPFRLAFVRCVLLLFASATPSHRPCESDMHVAWPDADEWCNPRPRLLLFCYCCAPASQVSHPGVANHLPRSVNPLQVACERLSRRAPRGEAVSKPPSAP